jgi:membrane protein
MTRWPGGDDPQPNGDHLPPAREGERGGTATRVDRDIDGPADLKARWWWATLKRTIREFRDDNLTDWAAALTYYAVLSIFPALLVLVALLGLVGQHPQTTDSLLKIVDDIGPSSAVDTFKPAIEGVIKSKGDAGALLGLGLLGAVWAASGYIGAFMRASNAIYEVEEGRPFWKLRPLQIVMTVVVVLILAIVAIAVVMTGTLAESVGGQIGLGDTAVTIWNIAKWPVLVAVVMGIFALLYYMAPNVRHPGFRWITPGGVVAVLLWIVASAGFAFYVANFGSYNKTYGSLGAVIVFLVWLWISNIAVLFGAELNSELERSRELEQGLPAEKELQLEPRSEPSR